MDVEDQLEIEARRAEAGEARADELMPGRLHLLLEQRGQRAQHRGRGLIDDADREGHAAAVEMRVIGDLLGQEIGVRSEEHTSELQSLMRISYAVFCLKKKKTRTIINNTHVRQCNK